jgi:hypothetical protein
VGIAGTLRERLMGSGKIAQLPSSTPTVQKAGYGLTLPQPSLSYRSMILSVAFLDNLELQLEVKVQHYELDALEAPVERYWIRSLEQPQTRCRYEVLISSNSRYKVASSLSNPSSSTLTLT